MNGKRLLTRILSLIGALAVVYFSVVGWLLFTSCRTATLVRAVSPSGLLVAEDTITSCKSGSEVKRAVHITNAGKKYDAGPDVVIYAQSGGEYSYGDVKGKPVALTWKSDSVLEIMHSKNQSFPPVNQVAGVTIEHAEK
jgi:hypothetical protein